MSNKCLIPDTYKSLVNKALTRVGTDEKAFTVPWMSRHVPGTAYTSESQLQAERQRSLSRRLDSCSLSCCGDVFFTVG